MRKRTVWARLLGVEDTVVERVRVDEEEGLLVASVRPGRRERGRCGTCRRRCPGYDAGDGRRRWRALDLGSVPTYLEAEAPRVQCPEHGVTVAAVPWARHEARHTRAFDDQAAWLAAHCSRSAVAELLRTTWRTVGAIVERVVADARAERDPCAGLSRIGIDEVSFRRGQRYLLVVVDHDQRRLVWAAEGRDRKTLRRFFDALGPQRCEQITLVSADAAEWIADVVRERCPGAELCTDPFHVVSWATDALDEVRRETWNQARRAGQKAVARELKGARFALWKNPEDLTRRQKRKLASIARTNARLYRAYLLKEQLRQVFHLPTERALALLEEWLRWARRSRLPAFVKLARSITENRAGIAAALRHRLSNALVESVNTKLRLITRVAFGFHSSGPLIALAMLSLGGYCPPLPGRSS